MMMARLSLLNILPRLASVAPFLCLIVAQWECPDMLSPHVWLRAGVSYPPMPAGGLSLRPVLAAVVPVEHSRFLASPRLLLGQEKFLLNFLIAIILRSAMGRVVVQCRRFLPCGPGFRGLIAA